VISRTAKSVKQTLGQLATSLNTSAADGMDEPAACLRNEALAAERWFETTARTASLLDRGLIAIEQPCDRALRLAGIEQLEGLLLLVLRELWWPAEADALLARA
jgi:hypothetical protein